MYDAIEAIKSLITAGTATQITEALLQTLRHTPEMRIGNDKVKSDLDFEGFGILAKCQPTHQGVFRAIDR